MKSKDLKCDCLKFKWQGNKSLEWHKNKSLDYRWHKGKSLKWIPVSSTSKISNGWIRDLGFNPSAYSKNWLVFWSYDKELSLEANAIDWNSLLKKR